MENYRYRVFYESDGKREFMISPGQFSTFKKPMEWTSFEKAVNATTSASKQIKPNLYIMRINVGNTETKFFSPLTKLEVKAVIGKHGLPNSPEVHFPDALRNQKKNAAEIVNPLPVLNTAGKKPDDRIDIETLKLQLTEDIKNAVSGKHASGKADTVTESMNALKTAKHAKPEEKEKVEKVEKAEEIPEENSKVAEMMNIMSRMLGYMRNSDEMHDDLTKEVENEDNAIIDILHYIELSDKPMTPEEAYSVVSALRERRRIRRAAKDQLMMIDGLRQDTKRTTGQRISTYNMETAIGILAVPRHYVPRVIKDMHAEIAKYAVTPQAEPDTEPKQEADACDVREESEKKKPKTGIKRPRMTPEEIAKITEMYNRGIGPYTIAKEIGRPGTSVQNVIRRGKKAGTITRA